MQRCADLCSSLLPLPQLPGNAYDASIPGMQYFFDYIIPRHPDAAPFIMKLLGEGGQLSHLCGKGEYALHF